MPIGNIWSRKLDYDIYRVVQKKGNHNLVGNNVRTFNARMIFCTLFI